MILFHVASMAIEHFVKSNVQYMLDQFVKSSVQQIMDKLVGECNDVISGKEVAFEASLKKRKNDHKVYKKIIRHRHTRRLLPKSGLHHIRVRRNLVYTKSGMRQLISTWKMCVTKAYIFQEASTVKKMLPKAMKVFPADPQKYHPVMLLNQLNPGIIYTAILRANPPSSVFEVYFEMYGVQFVGRGSNKKGAKTEACIAAIDYFWNFNFHDI